MSDRPNPLDAAVSSLLGGGDYVSRRSWLGRQFQWLLGLAGVAAAARTAGTNAAVPPRTRAETYLETCGIIHGYYCAGNCAPDRKNDKSGDPSKAGSSWVSCCRQNPMKEPKKYQCYQLWDWVGTRKPNWPKDCAGTDPGTSSVWPQGLPGKYICTEFKAVGDVVDTLAKCDKECEKAGRQNLC